MTTAELILRYNLKALHEANSLFWDDYDLNSICCFDDVPAPAAWMMTSESYILIFMETN